MWTVTNTNLPLEASVVETGFPIATVKTGGDNLFAPIADVFMSPVLETTPVTLPIEAVSNTNIAIIPTENLIDVESVEVNGVTYTKSLSPISLITGQFYYGELSGDLYIKGGAGYPILQGGSVRINAIRGEIETPVIADPVPSKEIITVPPGYKNRNKTPRDLDTNIAPIENFVHLADLNPVFGQVSWTRSFQQHPTAQIDLLVEIKNIAGVRSRFRVGSPFTLLNIGFVVQSYSEEEFFTTDSPEEKYYGQANPYFKVSVSLDGKWKKPLSKPVFLKSRAGISISPSGQDPECQFEQDSGNNIFDSTLANTRTLPDMGRLANVNIVSVERYPIKIPNDTPSDATTTVASLIDKFVQPRDLYPVYSYPDRVSIERYSSAKSHNISPRQIRSSVKNTYTGDKLTKKSFNTPFPDPKESYVSEIDLSGDLPSDTIVRSPYDAKVAEVLDIIPHAYYDNVQVTGKFSEDTTVTESSKAERPKWRRLGSKETKLKEGDLDVASPPENTNLSGIKTLSLNWDSGGPLKTLKESTFIDGSPIEEKTQTWGFVYLGENGTEFGTEVVFTAQWKQVRLELTNYEYSSEGYLLSVTTTGWDLRRYRQESEALETKQFSAPSDSSLRRLYVPFKLPLYSRTDYLLEAYSFYYSGEDYSSAYELYKKCNRSGTSSYEYVPNPNYVIPLFVKQEQKEVTSFASVLNPEASDDNPLPRITTGEESFYTRYIEIGQDYFRSLDKSRNDTPTSSIPKEWYVEYTANQNASDSGFKNASRFITFKEYEGRPPQAQRRSINYERVQPEKKDPDEGNKTYSLLVSSEGTANLLSPITESINFEEALTPNVALTYARNSLEKRDFLGSVDTSVSVKYNPFYKEGDRVNLATAACVYSRRIKSVSQSVKMEFDPVSKRSIFTSDGTNLSLGIERSIPLESIKRPTPQGLKPKIPPPPPNKPPGRSGRLRLGSLTSEFTSRRN